MTEVPEHLLARSKAARAKSAGGGGGDDAGSPPATPGEAPGTGAAASAVEPAGQAAVPAPVAEPPKPVPPYVAASLSRPRIPRFAIPVLASLPVWALIYAGALTSGGGPEDPELALGQSVYTAQCSGCHGAGGEGGTGRPLNQVIEVFPDRADHIAWVQNGSPEAGTPYGDPAVGRVSQEGAYGAMPGFADSLSPEEIAAVVRYEREHFGGEAATPTGAEGGEATEADGEQQVGNTESGGSAENEAQTSGGDVDGENPESGGDAGVEGGEGSGTDASPAGDSTGGSTAGGGTGSGTGGQPGQ